MSDKTDKSDKVNRRKLLGSLGAAAGALGSSTVVKAVSASPDRQQAPEDFESVQKVLRAVGNPEVKQTATHVGSAEGVKLRMTSLDTQYGVLRRLEVEQSEVSSLTTGHTETFLEINKLSARDREELPDRFSATPLGVDVNIVHVDEGVSVFSSVTTEERRHLSSVLPVNEFTAVYSSGEYRVEHEGEQFIVNSTSSRPRVTDVEVDRRVVSDINGSACFDCAQGVPECSTCAPKCQPDPNNVLQCGACVLQRCADVDASACVKCIGSIPGYLVEKLIDLYPFESTS